MRVVEAKAFGDPDVLVVSEAPDPVAGPGQVIIDVSAIDTLFVETQIRRGAAPWFGVEPPYVPGGGVAGQVISTGEGVDPGWAGRRVVTRTRSGYAERALASAEDLVPVPSALGFREAAALVHDGVTGMALAGQARVRPGERVLITAAAGGMGVLLVQLAHAAGARVIGAARGDRKLELVRRLGADAAVDYSQDGWPGRIREAAGGAGLDVVFDGAGGHVGRDAFEMTVSGGRFSAHGAAGGGFADINPQEAERRGITVRGIKDVQLGPPDVVGLTEAALTAAAAGRISPVIGRTFPLEKAADAHAAIEAREVTGKTLLLP